MPPCGAEGQIALIEADTLRLPFPDGQFQIVCVAFGLRNVADTDAGLREMVRVCRPGGRVAVLEFSTPTVWPLGAIYSWYFRRVLPRIGQALARNTSAAYDYLPQSVGSFPQGRSACRTDAGRRIGQNQATSTHVRSGDLVCGQQRIAARQYDHSPIILTSTRFDRRPSNSP